MSDTRQHRPSPDSQPPLTDSPWFWLYLFSTFALIVAIAFAPKIALRQQELDLEAQAKRQALADDTGADAPAGPDQASNRVFRFRTLLALLGIFTAAGWIGLWWKRLRPSRRSEDVKSDNDGSVRNTNSGSD